MAGNCRRNNCRLPQVPSLTTLLCYMDNERVMSRRRWVAIASAPAIAAAVTSTFSRGARAADPPQVDDNLLGAKIYNIRDLGAKGDGTTLDTAAVQAAIDAAARDGGGTVLVPAGDFVVGTIELKSHVTLHLASRGRLLGSPKIED